jgi:hemerythrin-like metal-binding protein
MGITWNTRSDTGIQIIDEQHQELFGVVDRLRRMIEEGAARGAVEILLGDLLACTERHFATEETYMSKFGYPDFPQHVSEHASMLTSLHELQAKFQESHQSMALTVPTFMEGWLKHHINDGDLGFVTFLKAHNLAWSLLGVDTLLFPMCPVWKFSGNIFGQKDT